MRATVGAEVQISFGSETTVRAVVHKAIQHCGRLLLDPLEILASATHVNIDGADIHEDAVSKFTRKFSLHALQCMDASRRGSSRLQNSGMAAWIERWRIGNFGIRNPAQRFVCRADFSSDGRIMGVVEQAKGDRDAGDNHSHPAAFRKFVDQCDEENAAGHQEP